MGIQGISGGCSNFLFFPKILGGGVKGFFMFTPDNLGRLYIYIYILKRKWHMYFSIELLQPTTSWLFQLVSRCRKKSAGFREFLQGPEKVGPASQEASDTIPILQGMPRQVANAPYGREARTVVFRFLTVCLCETYRSQKTG